LLIMYMAAEIPKRHQQIQKILREKITGSHFFPYPLTSSILAQVNPVNCFMSYFCPNRNFDNRANSPAILPMYIHTMYIHVHAYTRHRSHLIEKMERNS
jgi:hypothetical protein